MSQPLSPAGILHIPVGRPGCSPPSLTCLGFETPSVVLEGMPQQGLGVQPPSGIEALLALGLEASWFWDVEDKPAPSDPCSGLPGGLSSPKDLSWHRELLSPQRCLHCLPALPLGCIFCSLFSLCFAISINLVFPYLYFLKWCLQVHLGKKPIYIYI